MFPSIFQDLILVHTPRSNIGRFSTFGTSGDFCAEKGIEASSFVLETCLRRVVLGLAKDAIGCSQQDPERLSGEQLQFYYGENAYRFLLQIICGIHSPLIGETEVLGQFKSAAADFLSKPRGISAGRLRPVLQALLEDAKRIRSRHLEGLGQTSYGSLLRRELKIFAGDLETRALRVSILGAGQLVQKLLPWIVKDHIDVSIYSRDVEKARNRLSKFASNVHFETLMFPSEQFANSTSAQNAMDASDEFGLSRMPDVVVIAASISAKRLHEWIVHLSNQNAYRFEMSSRWLNPEQSVGPSLVVDLRGESEQDSLKPLFALNADQSRRLIVLRDFLTQLNLQDESVQKKKAAAIHEIDRCVHNRIRSIENRPFGWEDVGA